MWKLRGERWKLRGGGWKLGGGGWKLGVYFYFLPFFEVQVNIGQRWQYSKIPKRKSIKFEQVQANVGRLGVRIKRL